MSTTTHAPWNLESETVGDEIRVRLSGSRVSLDEPDTERIEDLLTRLVERAGRSRLVLDLANVTYLSSYTLSVFIRLHRRLREVGGSVVLNGVLPQISELLEVTHLDRLLEVRSCRWVAPN